VLCDFDGFLLCDFFGLLKRTNNSCQMNSGVCRRVNKERLSSFVGQTVLFLGRVESVTNTTDDSTCSAILQSPDGYQVKCVLQEAPKDKYIEFVAKVRTDETLEQSGFLFNLGDELSESK